MSSLIALRRGAEALASTSQASANCRLSAPRMHQRRRRSHHRPLRPTSSLFSSSSSSSRISAQDDDDVFALDCELEELELEKELDVDEPELDRPPRARPAPKGSLSKPNGLAASAAAFAADVAAGVSPEDAAAAALGASDVSGLTEAQKKYSSKIADALAAKAEADARAKAARAAMFEKGKFFYSKGSYRESVKALTQALDAEGPFSQLGGEISIWLALAHAATGPDGEKLAVEIYKEVEASHPSPKMKKQAADLRYILEAPKLRVGKDEKVALPEVEEASRSEKGGDRRRAPRPPPAPRGGRAPPKRPKTLEERWMEEYRPPKLVPNKYVAVAATAVAVAAAVYSARVG